MLNEEGYIDVLGGRIWYRIEGADRAGTPIIALHGGPGAPHDYLEPLARLNSERPVVFYDQLGCGNSDRPDDVSLWTVKRFVDELAVLRRELSLSRVHIMGQSWGCMLAADYMLSGYDEGVESLILSGPCLSTSLFVADQRRYLEEMPADVRDTILACEASWDYESDEYANAVMEYYRLYVCRLDPWPECMNRAMEKMGQGVYEYMWGPSEFTMTGTLKDYNRVPDLNKIRVPVLFTCGRYDEATPDTTALYHNSLPGSEMVVIENASHEHHLEKTEEYLGVVKDFLRKVESRETDL